MEFKSGLTALSTSVNGKPTKPTVKVPYTTLTVTFMRDSGLTTRPVVRVRTHMRTEPSMLGNGRTISKMDMGSSNGRMVRSMKESIRTVPRQVREYWSSLTRVSIRVSSWIMRFMEKVLFYVIFRKIRVVWE